MKWLQDVQIYKIEFAMQDTFTYKTFNKVEDVDDKRKCVSWKSWWEVKMNKCHESIVVERGLGQI